RVALQLGFQFTNPRFLRGDGRPLRLYGRLQLLYGRLQLLNPVVSPVPHHAPTLVHSRGFAITTLRARSPCTIGNRFIRTWDEADPGHERLRGRMLAASSR